MQGIVEVRPRDQLKAAGDADENDTPPLAAEQVLQAVCRSGRGLAELLDGVTLFPQTLINVRLQSELDWKSHPGLARTEAEVQAELGDRGRVLIRKSGTEPLLRVMVEAQEAELAWRCAQRLADSLQG